MPTVRVIKEGTWVVSRSSGSPSPVTEVSLACKVDDMIDVEGQVLDELISRGIVEEVV